MQSDLAAAQPLVREDAEFLAAFAAAWQRAQIYPEGHPTLERAVEHAMQRLEPVLALRPAFLVRVSPTRLLIGPSSSDPAQTVFQELAGRLFRRNVGSVRLGRGVTRAEVVALLVALSQDTTERLKLTLPHLRLEPLNFEGLALDDSTAGGAGEASPRTVLWAALGQAVFGLEDNPGVAGAGFDPEALAAGFDTREPDPRRDGAVIEYLHQAARLCDDQSSPAAQALQRQVSTLLQHLRPASLERLLRQSRQADPANPLRRDLLLLAGPDAALEVLQASARLESRPLAEPMVRLLRKLAERARQGPARLRHLAAEQFEGLVGELLASWESPGVALIEPLDHLPPPLLPELTPAEAYRSDPLRILTMQLDTGELGPSAERVVAALVGEGRVRPLVDIMGRLPKGEPLARAFCPLVLAAPALSRVLADVPVDIETLERLAPEVGPSAIPALLDALAASEERSLRRRLLELLAHFGNAVVPGAVERLPGAPWYVQRNLLRLLQMVPEPQVEAVASEYARHPDPRVRVEGFRLLMRHPGLRAQGIMAGLSDPDSSGVRVAVMAAGEDCPPSVAPLLLRGLAEGRIDPGLVASALRALGPMVQEPAVVQVLLRHAGRKLPVLGWRVASRSKESLAALAALARHWGDHPVAAALLARARSHADPAIRQAATP